MKIRRIWICAVVAMALAGTALTGCGAHREKIDLSETAGNRAETDKEETGRSETDEREAAGGETDRAEAAGAETAGGETGRAEATGAETAGGETDRSETAGTETGKAGQEETEGSEFVIEPEAASSEAVSENTKEPSDEDKSTEAGQTGSSGSEPARKKTAAEYEAGQVLTAGEISEPGVDAFFYQAAIGERLYQRMNGKSYRSGCPVAVEDLRYLRVLHYGYQGEIRVGELVCNKSISEDLLSIFRKLYDARYPIEKMLLIDDYDGDDDRSSSDNNTSCFNYRNVPGKESLSRHAYGIAIDINPVHNPYVVTDGEGNVTYLPANGSRYADRTKSFSHKIDEDDLCYRLFTEAGFTWGGFWKYEPDYMHFSKGSIPET